MEAVRTSLNQLLIQQGKPTGLKMRHALAEIFQYKLEGLVTNKTAKALIKLLDQGLKKNRAEIIFGLKTHDQIIKALAESHGYPAGNVLKGLNLLVQNGKTISDGLPDTITRKNTIRAKIPLQAAVAPVAPPQVPPQVPPQAPPTSIVTPPLGPINFDANLSYDHGYRELTDFYSSYGNKLRYETGNLLPMDPFGDPNYNGDLYLYYRHDPTKAKAQLKKEMDAAVNGYLNWAKNAFEDRKRELNKIELAQERAKKNPAGGGTFTVAIPI